ncbi:hypothetical protein IIZ77_02235 [Candidatus Saccharibacteria bacterium]|nr:hypothetical protein [Candidatus Saccharibacteria bacterium]
MLDNLGYIFLSVVVSCICFGLAQQSMKDQLTTEIETSNFTKKQVRAKYREHARNVRLLWIIGLVWLASIVITLIGSSAIVALIFTVAAILGLGYLLIKKKPGKKQVDTIKFLAVALGLGLGLILGKLINAGAVTYFTGIAGAVAIPVIVYFVAKADFDDIDDDDDEEPAPAREVVTQPTSTPEPLVRHEEPTPQQARTARPTAGYRPAKATSENVNNPPRRRRSGLQAQSDDGGDRNFDSYIIEQLSKTEEGRQQLIAMLKAKR